MEILIANPGMAYANGRSNALRQNDLVDALAQRKEARAMNRENMSWNREVRARQRQAWTREDRDAEILRKIDLTKPYRANKDKISQLSPDTQNKLISYYANNDQQERKRHKEISDLSQRLALGVLPLVKDQGTYTEARNAILEQMRNSGLVSDQELQEKFAPAFPEQYDPQWVQTRLAMYGYKPQYQKVPAGASLYRDGKLIATAPAKKTAGKKEITPEKAVVEIAKAREKIARLAQTKGLSAGDLFALDKRALKKLLSDNNLPKATQEAIMAQRDVIDYYSQFIEKPQTPNMGNGAQRLEDPQKVYNSLRDSGKTHEEAVQAMIEMGYK